MSRSQKRLKPSIDSEVDDVMLIDDELPKTFQNVDWLKAFQPKDIKDLALHPKKLEDLRNWFSIVCSKIPNKILLIEGAAGTTKTTSLKLVSKECGYDVIEWINCTDLETALLCENHRDFSRDYVAYENQVSKFSDFVLRNSRFQSLVKKKKRLLLVKDFPNTFLKKSEEFWSILKQYVEGGMSPLVFIITETSSKAIDVGYKLFPEKIRIELGIDTIALNPVSATLMKRALKRISQITESDENFKSIKKPTEQEIDSCIEQSQGDIRNAVLNLNLASQRGDFKFVVPKAPPMAKKGTKKKSSGKPKAGVGKNEALSLMHGLGRVFYPKLELNETTKQAELTHKPEDIAESFSTQPSNFIQMIHSNYIKNFSNIDDVSEAADIFSLADCLESEYRDDQLSLVNLNLVIRSAMVLNKTPAVGFRKITAYASKKWKGTEAANRENLSTALRIINNGNMMGKKDFFCDYNFFLSANKM